MAARHRLIGAAALATCLAAAACIENLPKPSTVVASVSLSPDSCVLRQGDTLTLSATARNAAHVVLPDAELGWASSDLGVVSVTLTGLIRGIGPGTATVYATADAASAHTTVTVVPPLAGLRISPDGATLVPGGSYRFVADAVTSSGTLVARLAPDWSSSDTMLLRVDSGGVATALAPGAAWVVARDEGRADSVAVRALSVRFTAVSAGPYQNTCATGPQGTFCWGYEGNTGTLGSGAFVTEATTPTGVVGGSRFSTVGTGEGFACGLTRDGAASCWGNGAFGRLGDGTSDTNRPGPVAVEGSLALLSFSVGRRHTCGLTSTGEAWCWGGNTRGALGVPLATEQSTVPVKVATEQRFASVHAGDLHTCALAPDSTAWCWGRGTELGDSEAVTRPTPAPVYGDHRFRTLSVGWVHTCGIATDDASYCWGYNPAGELGRADVAIGTVPLPVENAPPLVSITAGYYTTCGLTADGTAWCWGWNNAGQLGTGDTLGGPTPRPVAGGLHFTALSLGYVHSCGLATDGLLYCWGSDVHGMLGDGGDTGQEPVPVPVPVAGQTPALPGSARRR
jgi:hypothetical protein